MDKFNRGETDIFKVEIDEQVKANFLDMARWTKFLAILGFVFMGLILALGIFISVFLTAFAENYGGQSGAAIANMGAAGPIAVMVFFVIFIGMYVYPTYALYKYSVNIKAALNTDSKEKFNKAIRYLKNMFKYMGILMIVILAMYGVQVVLGVFA